MARRWLWLSVPAVVLAAEVTPVQKVVQMLTKMKVDGDAALQDERKTFEKYQSWATLRDEDLSQNIQFATAKEEELVASITKADSDAEELGNQISSLGLEIDKLSQEKQAATEDRTEQHEEYLKVSQDYGESVAALEQAIQVLSAQDYDKSQAEAMLQEMARKVPGMPRVLAAFIQERPENAGFLQRAPGAPAVAAYEFQSSKILDMLKGLLDRFRVELGDLDKAEMNEAHAFAMIEVHLSNTIERDTEDRAEKIASKAVRMQESAQGKAELAQVRDDKAADEKLKSEIQTTFVQKQGAFRENQRVRTDELTALAQAIEILSGGDVQAGYAKHIAAELQRPAAAAAGSFLQLGRSRRRAAERETVVAFLGAKAAALHSRKLAKLVEEATANPFAKVIDMVEMLLERLQQEAASEADHKAWCDKELKDNKIKRDKKTAEAERLAAEIESLSATVSDMAASIEKLAQEQATLATSMVEATDLRTKEKAENEVALKDAVAGAEAVQKALVVLKGFYEAQGVATLLQKQVPELAAYNGQQRENAGVIGMLEVIASDFERLRAETQNNEATAQQEYDAFMKTCGATKKEKHDSEFQLSLDKDETEFKKSQAEKDLMSTNEELGQANKYFNELKPSCIQVHVSFEERAKSREQEVEALHEAWKILDRKSKE